MKVSSRPGGSRELLLQHTDDLRSCSESYRSGISSQTGFKSFGSRLIPIVHDKGCITMCHIFSGLEGVQLEGGLVHSIKIEPFHVRLEVEVILDAPHLMHKKVQTGESRRLKRATLSFCDVRSVAWIMNPGSNMGVNDPCGHDRVTEIQSTLLNHLLIGDFGRLEIVSSEPKLKLHD